MRRRAVRATVGALALGALASGAFASGAFASGAVAQPPSHAALSPADRRQVVRGLLAVLHPDVTNGEALYEGQQEGMALADALFAFGTPADQDTILRAAATLVRGLPTARTLAARDFLSRNAGRVELRWPVLTRVRQRVTQLAFSIDGVPLPTSGPSRGRRVFPMVVDGRVRVMSEDEMQFAYLLSTLVRLAAAHPLAPRDPLATSRAEALDALVDFLVRDKVRFYWREAPAWHWSGPFPSMRERVRVKLANADARVTSPPWFGAIVDHELHLFGVAADLQAAARLDARVARRIGAADRAMLDDVNRSALAVLRARVTGGPSGDGFLFDFGRWTTNPSYAYAGCTASRPLPAAPCAVDSVATDVSHARRWPWWLRSMEAAWPAGSAEARAIAAYRARLARQFATGPLYFDAQGRPLNRTFMNGVDGWYRYRESPGHPQGHGPSTLTGSMRYGSWALLAPLNERIATAERRFCAIVSDTSASARAFRTAYYGAPSDAPALGGLGERDLYGAGTMYALTCRVQAALGFF